jgi:hypothetical protein
MMMQVFGNSKQDTPKTKNFVLITENLTTVEDDSIRLIFVIEVSCIVRQYRHAKYHCESVKKHQGNAIQTVLHRNSY